MVEAFNLHAVYEHVEEIIIEGLDCGVNGTRKGRYARIRILSSGHYFAGAAAFLYCFNGKDSKKRRFLFAQTELIELLFDNCRQEIPGGLKWE